MAAKPFDPHTCIQTLVGLEPSVPCLPACDKTDVLPNELSWFGSFVKCLTQLKIFLNEKQPTQT